MDAETLRSMPTMMSRFVQLYLRQQSGEYRMNDAIQQQEFERTLPSIWNLISSIILDALPTEVHAQLDETRPGYLVFPVDELHVLVPFFVASVFPSGEVLKAICDLAGQLKLGTDSVICVSGSACQLSSELPIGDLDYCEYLPKSDSTLIDNMIQRLRDASSEAPCIRLELGTKVWARNTLVKGPNGKDGRWIGALRKSMSQPGIRQCGFVAEVPNLGVLEATNVYLLLDYSAPNSEEANNSFAAQEAPLCKDCWTPRSLTSPLALGEYVAWLIARASHLCEESRDHPRAIVKAARRTMSATRLLWMSADTNVLVSRLGGDAARLAALYDRCRLYRAIKRLRDPVVMERFAKKLRQSIDSLRNPGMRGRDYTRLTKEESVQFDELRDQLLPVVLRIIDKINQTIGIDPSKYGAGYERKLRRRPARQSH